MLNQNTALDVYAVFGNPIAHSKSPLIHAAFAKQTGQLLIYRAQLVPQGDFAKAVQTFQAEGGKGLNVTVPFKQEAWTLVEERRPAAERAGAVNTIWFDAAGRRIGDNTDGIGLMRDLTLNHHRQLKGQDILILGAGGAARGTLELLLAEQPARLVIVNRTLAKAQELAELFGSPACLSVCSYDELNGQYFDLIINGTSAGLQAEMPPLPDGIFKLNGLGYDMLYGKMTPFMRWTQAQGAIALGGLGMLVEQAAESFYLWRGVRPQTGAVINELLNQKTA